MKLNLERKVVLVTGGSKGIGLACARGFAEEKARVAIASRSQENLDRARQTLAKEGFEVAALRGDLSNPADAQSIVSSTERLLGPIDVLVNSAGAANALAVQCQAAAVKAELEMCLAGSRPGHQVDDATDRVRAVDRRARSAQHLDSIQISGKQIGNHHCG